MQFMFKEQVVKLQGQGAKQDKQCFLNSFLEDKHSRGGLEWYGDLGVVEVESNLVSEADVMTILEQFPTVFKDHIQLPPER
ncbi:hypothetical protein A2U01_0083658, partial [Trifolium medium]|nr:hypothetical protein [Trifolium medium]